MKPLYTITTIGTSKIILHLALAIVLFSGCKKFIDVETPSTKTSTESAFKSDATASAAVTALYTRLSSEFNAPNLTGTSYYTELSADNLVLYNTEQLSLNAYYRSTLEPTYSDVTNATYWTNTYSLLYIINSSMIELTDNTALSTTVSKRLLGEVYFLRAFCYFYLVNLYGEVPLVLSINYGQTSKLPRNTVDQVYNQINNDLHKAEGLLTNTYVAGNASTETSERLRPNLAAVNALQARAFLYQKNYTAAEAAATKVISQSALYSLGTLQGTFLANSSETIFALQPVNIGFNTREGVIYLLSATGPDIYNPVYLSKSLMDSFEAGDGRKGAWTGSVSVTSGTVTDTFPFAAKYKVAGEANLTTLTEYTIVLRLAEQYLVRAEARNEQNNTAGAAQDLNALRTRSRMPKTDILLNPLPDLSTSLTQTQLRTAILHERQVELFTEWGHRWFDLRRSGTIDAVLTPIVQSRGGAWSNYKALYPIPASEILLNPVLTQNPGYIK
jgi:hypothetical protein